MFKDVLNVIDKCFDLIKNRLDCVEDRLRVLESRGSVRLPELNLIKNCTTCKHKTYVFECGKVRCALWDCDTEVVELESKLHETEVLLKSEPEPKPKPTPTENCGNCNHKRPYSSKCTKWDSMDSLVSIPWTLSCQYYE